MYGEKPDISHLRVFGCGAYVYLHPDVRKNKLAPKSELMIHLGEAEGQKGWRFMHTTNRLFYAANALFDELLFPKCKDKRCPTTRANEPKELQPLSQPDSPAQFPPDLWDDVEAARPNPPVPPRPQPPIPPRGRPCTPAPRRSPTPSPKAKPGLPLPPRYRMVPGVDLDTPPRPPPQPPRSPYRHRAALPRSRSRSQSRSPTPAPRRSQRSTKGKAPAWPGNIYGEQRHPTDIEVDTRQIKRWESLVESEPSSPEPGPSRLPGGFETPAVSPQPPPAPLPPQSPVPEEGVSEEESNESDDESDEEDSSGDTATSDGSQAEVEGLLQTNYLHSLAKEGGVAYMNHLLAMAVPPNDSEVPDTSRVRE